MKRSVLLTVALSVFILGTGCREPEEISKEEYKQVMALAKEEFVKEGLAYGSDLPSITFKVPKWISKRVKVTIHFRTHLFCRIPQMAMKPGRIRRTAQRVIRRACRKTDVAFKDFDLAHSVYGRLNLSYSEELHKLNELLKEFTPVAHQVLDEKGISIKEATRIARPADTAILARLDTTLVERASWLAFDMGLPLGGEYRIFIETSENGEIKIDGETRTIKEYVAPIMVKDPYRLVYIVPDSQLAVGKLFELLDSVRITGAQRAAISNMLSNAQFLNAMHVSHSGERTGMSVYVEINEDDQVIMNGEQLDLFAENLDSLIASATRHGNGKYHKCIVLLADEKASCGQFLRVCFTLQKAGGLIAFAYERPTNRNEWQAYMLLPYYKFNTG